MTMTASRREEKARFAEAMALLDEGKARAALYLSEILLASDISHNQISGYLCRGFVYEDGGHDLPADLDKAIDDYRQVAAMVPSPPPFCCIARASMKKNHRQGYADGLAYLQRAASMGVTAEVLLGFAHYHRTHPDTPDLRAAQGYYLRAAKHGRFAGFFGYSSMARQLGQPVRALAMDTLRILSGPFLALLLGRRTQETFTYAPS